MGWQAAVAEMHAEFDIDDEGYLTSFGSRIDEEDADDLPPCLQLYVRSRYSLGEVPVHERPSGIKDDITHVNLVTAREALTHLIRLQCQYRATHAASVDGTKVEKTGANGRGRDSTACSTPLGRKPA